MSRVREIWLYDPATGLPILVDAAGNLPVRLGDAAGQVVDLDAAQNVPVTLMDATGNVMTLEPNGSVPVTLQDQHTPAIISPMWELVGTTTMGAELAEATTITVASVVGIVADSHLVLADPISGAFHLCDVVGTPVGLVVTIDTPLAFPFSAGSSVTIGDHEILGVGSLAAPITYQVRTPTPGPGTSTTFDVTRLILVCQTATAVDLSMFGNIAGGLANGIVLRKNNGNGTYQSIFNAKTNFDLVSFMYDFNVYQKSNPAQGQDGFSGRITFAGQNKMGVVIRLEPGTDLECLVQDDLSSLESFTIIAEGSVVQP